MFQIGFYCVWPQSHDFTVSYRSVAVGWELCVCVWERGGRERERGCVGTHAKVGKHMCAYAYGDQRSTSGVLLQVPSTLIVSFALAWSSPRTLVDWASKFQGSGCLSLPSSGMWAHTTTAGFFTWVLGLKCSSHACTSTFPTEISPQPTLEQNCSFLK